MGLNFSLNLEKESKKGEESILDKDQVYDVLIIGGGPAGLNAALYSKRKGANVGVIAKSIGGQVSDTSSVENYLGYPSMSGEGLVRKFTEHVKELNIPILTDSIVSHIEVNKNSQVKEVVLSNGDSYKGKTLILATGSKPRRLGIPGENEYLGKGVAYCAICDGPLFTDRNVVVAGGGNSAVEAAMDLAKIANKVTVIHRSEFRADDILVSQLRDLNNIDVLLNTQIKEIMGDGLVTGVKTINKNTNEESTISTDGVFVEIGYIPNSDPFKDTIKVNERGEIIVDIYGKTSVEGIFAAGDVTTIPYKQIIISAADGAKSALAANDYLNTLK